MVSCINPNIFFYFKKIFSSFERMDIVQRRRNFWRQKTKQPDEDDEDELELISFRQPKHNQIGIEGDIIYYQPDETQRIGLYVASKAIDRVHNYFEVEIMDSGSDNNISIGLVPTNYSMQKFSVWNIVYHADNGEIYRNSATVDKPVGKFMAPRCNVGDRMGCGLRFDQMLLDDNSQRIIVPVFLTKNRKEVGNMMIEIPTEGLFPVVSMHSCGEEVKLNLDLNWNAEDDTNMSIDGNEDDWLKLHDVWLNGNVLEYTGRGKSITDVGLAQARIPLDTTSHYFELEIINPGENCYVAIGLTRRDYPKHRHPGWNKGSIAYHADDGKIFNGSGNGELFGPRCHRGDVMGCGINFPRDYVLDYNCDGDAESDDYSPSSLHDNQCFQYDDYLDEYPEDVDSDSEDEEWWKQRNAVESETFVKVFFTRNGIMIGSRDVCIPKGGFYPTVGMLSLQEKVKFDLHPLTG